MKQIHTEVLKTTAGSGVIIAHLVKFATAKSGAEFLRLLCRILGFALPLPVAMAIRILLIASSGWAAVDGIKKLCPLLYIMIQESKREPAYE